MSRYLVDKFLYRLHHDEAALAAYVVDPPAYVRHWQEHEAAKREPGERIGAAMLTDEEREALASRDVGRLYAMGAHPFMLVGAMAAAYRKEYPDQRSWSEFYVSQIAPHGRPDVRP
jgi:hypothetical protein